MNARARRTYPALAIFTAVAAVALPLGAGGCRRAPDPMPVPSAGARSPARNLPADNQQRFSGAARGAPPYEGTARVDAPIGTAGKNPGSGAQDQGTEGGQSR